MANMNFGVNILPKANNTYSLGNSDYKWNIYANTINGANLTNLFLPSVTSDDNGKILRVSNGAWAAEIAGYLTSHQDISGKANSAALADAFDATETYNEGDKVSHEGNVYVRKSWGADTPAAEAWDATHWDLADPVQEQLDGKLDKYYDYTAGLDGSLSTKAWGGTTSFSGYYIWNDGNNIYYSYNSYQYRLNKEKSLWLTKTWTGLTSFAGDNVWTDGDNIYYSYNTNQYVLNKSTSTWSTKTWTGVTSFNANYVWTDGENIYYSNDYRQYVLDKLTSTWSSKTWNGLSSFYGSYIWTDGENIYYSMGSGQYVLDKSTSTWSTKTWSGLTSFHGINIWNDGNNIYYSSSSTQYVLDKSTSTWSEKTWDGFTPLDKRCIWADGDNIYYSGGSSTQYVFNKVGQKIYFGTEGTFEAVLTSSDDLPFARKKDTILLTTLSMGRLTGTATGMSSTALGGDVTASGNYSHAEGYTTSASNNYAHAEGGYTTASGEYSHAEGSHATASNTTAHAEGYYSTASGTYTHAEGNTTRANGSGSHAEGKYTYANGANSHAEGLGYSSTDTTYGALGKADHAEGYRTKADSGTTSSYYGAHAEGNQTQATNNAAHAEGYYTTASGLRSHAEGSNTRATGTSAHAEGEHTTASGSYSHAEGYGSNASGAYAHAEGYSTTASGASSHAEGSNTKASSAYQHVSGTYNVEDAGILVDVSDSSIAEDFDPTKGYYVFNSVVKYNDTIFIAHANAPTYMQPPKYDTYNWHTYTGTTTGEEPEWENIAYAQNSIVKYTEDGVVGYYQNHYEITSQYLYPASSGLGGTYWHTQSSGYVNIGTTYEIIGAGAQYTKGRNIRKLDFYGNEYLHGDVYVGCADDSTGGTKLAKVSQIPDISGKLDASQKGAVNGVAELDSAGKVPSSQLPSYVDDVEEYASLSNFPATGESGKIYIALDTNITYRWGGSAYVPIGSDLALGETSTTAYRGDRGKAAYDHATDSGRLTTATASGLYKVAVTAEGHVASATAVQKSDITALGIPGQDTQYSDMTGASASAAGTHGLVPAPTSADVDKFLAGDGTYKSGGLPMVILSYGSSTWNDFLAAYNNNVIVYCRASSNANPGTGTQGRMAFMAYVGFNNSGEPKDVEFQYYRSVSSHSSTQMGDQVFIYKLTNAGAWSVTTREASIKEIKMDSNSAGSVSWSNNVVTLSSGLPKVTSSDNGKVLRVADGAWSVVQLPSASGVSF